MGLSFWQIAIVVLLFLLLFGRGKLPALMTDLADGITSFRRGLASGGNEGDPKSADAGHGQLEKGRSDNVATASRASAPPQS